MPDATIHTAETNPAADAPLNQWPDFIAARRRFMAVVNVKPASVRLDDRVRIVDQHLPFSPISACRTPSRFEGPPYR